MQTQENIEGDFQTDYKITKSRVCFEEQNFAFDIISFVFHQTKCILTINPNPVNP